MHGITQGRGSATSDEHQEHVVLADYDAMQGRALEGRVSASESSRPREAGAPAGLPAAPGLGTVQEATQTPAMPTAGAGSQATAPPLALPAQQPQAASDSAGRPVQPAPEQDAAIGTLDELRARRRRASRQQREDAPARQVSASEASTQAPPSSPAQVAKSGRQGPAVPTCSPAQQKCSDRPLEYAPGAAAGS